MPAPLIVTNIESHFQAIKKQKQMPLYADESKSDNKVFSNPYPSPLTSSTGAGYNFGMIKTASTGVLYGQPQFFSPVHTPINWQIPQKLREVNQWLRFYLANEPKVASAINFYSQFPINGFTLECKNMYVKKHFNDMTHRLNLQKWLRVISRETYSLGNCFPFLNVACKRCGGSGYVNGKECQHPGGTMERIVILNPDFVEVFSAPMSPEPTIALLPDEELKSTIMKKAPGHERFSERVRKLIMAGLPIPLDNRNVSHIKFEENGYSRYGDSLIRRLFPILAYKTKLMTAQWIIAERLILPIKIAKIGNDARPASDADLARAQEQLAMTANDPNLTLVTHHAFELDWYSSSGKILQLTNEFELIGQEILDGLMINKALLNGEGPSFQNASIGIEAMIDRLESWRLDLKHWTEEKVFTPVSKMRNFKERNEWGEEDYIVPRLKWNIMHLRDQQNYRQFMIQLYEKGLVSAKRVLNSFDIDYEEELELIKWEREKGAIGQAQPGGGGDMGGGFGGGMGGGGAPPPPGGDIAGMGGAPGGAPGGMGGGMGGGDMGVGGGAAAGVPAPMGKDELINIQNFGGKVMKKRNREKMLRQKKQLFHDTEMSGSAESTGPGGIAGNMSGLEKELMLNLVNKRKNGEIKHQIFSQYKVKLGSQPYTIDFAIPSLKIGIEADGAIWHDNPEAIRQNDERDSHLAQQGWLILRFKDHEIETRMRNVLEKIITTVQAKEAELAKFMEAASGK